MRRSMLSKSTAAALSLFLAVNLAGPAAWPAQPQPPAKAGQPQAGLALEYRFRPSTGLNDALNLLLADLAIYGAKQREAGVQAIRPDQIKKRWAEIEAHYGRVRRQLARDRQRIGSSPKAKRLDQIRAELDGQMAWYKTKIGVILNTGNKSDVRRQASEAIGKKILALQPKPLAKPKDLALRTPAAGQTAAFRAVGTGTDLSLPPTQELLDLVDRLGRDPLKIYRYVRNELDYEPYAGLVKGPERTLLEQAGNDLDLAALLAVLLRAAGYQARFVQGRVRLTIRQAMDWVGTTDPKLAAAFFSKNGIPAEILSSGGKYTGVILDHTWIRANLPYLPGGGREPDTWLDLDPSFKTYRFQYGRDAAAEIGIDPRQFLHSITSQAVTNDEQSFVTGLPEEQVYEQLQAWTEGVRRYAENNGLAADTIYLGRTIVREELDALPAGLPYQVQGTPAVWENLLAEAAVRFTVRGLDERGGTALSYTGDLHEIAGRRLTVSYRPAAPEDEEIIREFCGEPGFPVYLVQLVPEIKLDGQAVASGAPVGMGARRVFEFTYTMPDGAIDTTSKILTAGSVSALAMDLQRMPAGLVHQRAGDLRSCLRDLEAGRPPENDGVLGGVLYLWGLNYFLEADRLNAITASALDVALVRQPSHLLVSCEPQVEEIFGLPYRVQNLRLASWLGRDLLAPVAKNGEAAKEKQFLVTAALTASALQHGIFTQTAAGADAVSPLKIVQAANAEKIPIITLNRENCQRLLGYFPELTEAQRTELADLTNAGYTVTMPQKSVAVGAWRGNGCLIYDPFAGASQYRFLDSDWSGLCPAVLLDAGDLFHPGPRQVPLLKALTVWAGQFEQAMDAFAWSYIPAAAAIDAWFANAVEVDRAAFTAAAILLSCPIADFVTRPAILNARLTAAAFSPNADGRLDTLDLNAELTRNSAWQVAVTDAAGGQVRVFQGEGQAVAATWDGLDGAGVPAAEGAYSLTISAVDKEYATAARTATLRAALDLTPPTAGVTSPADGGTAQGYLNIVGTVDDPHLASYRVLMGAGTEPGAWTELTRGSTPVVEGSLGLAETYHLANGPYSLEIEAEDAAGNRTVHRSTFTVANADSAPRIRITSPLSGAMVAGDLAYAAEVTDDQPGVKVVFYLDGKEIACLDTPPYTGSFATHVLANGTHKLEATATDSAGRMTASEAVSFTTDNVLSELAAAPNPFSPNGDGWEDGTVVTAKIGRESGVAGPESWEIRIDDAGGSVVRSFSGSDTSISQAWDGKDAAGVVVPDGDYRAVVSLPDRGVTAEISLAVRGAAAPPLSDITAPADLSRVIGRVELRGYVRSAALRRWWVEYRPAGGAAWVTFLDGAAPVEGYLGVWDTTLLENGPYEVRINAEDTLGRRDAISNEYTVTGELKIGNYRLDLLDLQFSAGGLPAVVARGYDTLRKERSGEFGYGWTSLIRDVDLVQAANYDITLTLPGGRRTTFAFTPRFPYSAYNSRLGYAEYSSISGYPDKLSPAGLTMVYRNDDGSYTFLGPDLDEETGTTAPRYFKLETVDGLIYEIDKQTGVTRVSDRSGNSLTYTRNAITHNSGRAITLERDGQGRITKATGPDEAYVTYEYDSSGDLVKYTDATGAAYTYAYIDHALTGITGPEGKPMAVNDYDQSGRLSEVRDALGGTVRIIHDLGTRTETVVDRNGNATSYRYNERGDVIEKIDPLGRRWAYAYDPKGNLLVEIDPLGNTVRRTYDQSNNLLTETDALGNVTTYTYSDSLPTSVTDPLGRKTAYGYSGYNLTRYADPLGNAYGFAYETYGRMTGMADPLNKETQFSYKALIPDPAKVSDALGNAVDYAYDAAGLVKTETRYLKQPDGTLLPVVTTYEYNAAGKVTKVTRPDGTIEETEYTQQGQVKATILDGRRTEYFYDANGRNWKTTYPDGTYELYEYDSNGNRTSVQSRDGQVTQCRYDALDRLVKTIYADESMAETRYDAAGRVSAEIAANGGITQCEYDALGRQTKVIDPLGHETKFEYDAVGNQIAVIDALGNKTTSEYDAVNRLVRTTFADGTCISYEYDAAGRRIGQTDQLFLTTKYGYDALGRLTSVTDALNQVTRYVYNEQGRMTEQIDANEHTTRFAYDKMGRLLEKTLPLGQKETYEYNPDGSLKAKVDPRGIRTEYAYDPITKLLTSKAFSDGTRVDYAYYPDGRLKTATNMAGTLTYVYDAMGRLETLVDPNSNVISYAYDKAGNRTKIVGPHGEIKYTYDLLGRIETVTDQQGNVTRYSCDELGRQKKTTYANGTETVYAYDKLSRLTSVINRKTTGEVITSHKYTLNAAGHRVKIEEVGSAVEYGYDELYRLTSEKRNGIVALDDGFTYDPVGNRLGKTSPGGAQSYTYDENDRLLGDGRYTYGWDEAGNLVSRTGSEGTTTYRYDAENKLVEASEPEGTVSFVYDAMGNRVVRTTDGGTTEFVVDPNVPYAQVLEEGGLGGERVYAYGNDLVNVQGPEGIRWFAYDGLGSTRALTDASGTLIDEYVYEAFGTTVARTGSTPNDFMFAGEQYEPGLGMYYLRARYYSSESGRFGVRDPFAIMLQSSSYAYCSNNPIISSDPTGYITLLELAKAQGAWGVLIRAGIRGIVGGAIGYTMGFIDSLLGGANVRQALHDALLPAAIGTIGAIFGPVRIIRNILMFVGLVAGSNAAADSYEQGKGWQALFRAALVLVTVAGIRHSLRALVNDNAPSQAIADGDDTVRFTFRGDSRSPEEIIFSGAGFRARGNNLDLNSHVSGGRDTAYINTTTDPNIAARNAIYNGRPGYVYLIRIRNSQSFVNINEVMGHAHDAYQEQIFAVRGQVSVEDIVGWQLYRPNMGFVYGNFTKNPFYIDN